MTKTIRIFSFAVTFMAAGSSAGRLWAQHVNHVQSGPVSPVIDGAANPELISNQAALKVYLIAAADTPGDPLDSRRMRPKIVPLGLTAIDEFRLTEAIQSFRAILSQNRLDLSALLAATPATTAASATSQLVSVSQRLDSQVELAYNSLVGALSADGRLKLQSWLMHVKSRMKIVPPPAM